LASEPKGFSLETNFQTNCVICHAAISGDNGWWDLNGEKCLSCQNAVEYGVVPTYVCADRDSWYSTYELVNKFKISPSSVGTLVREGKLKSRKIKAISGPTNFEIFLKLENEFLKEYRKN
jgi:hypothetical protein